MQAASIPFGGLVVMHNHFIGDLEESSRRGAETQRLEERTIGGGMWMLWWRCGGVGGEGVGGGGAAGAGGWVGMTSGFGSWRIGAEQDSGDAVVAMAEERTSPRGSWQSSGAGVGGGAESHAGLYNPAVWDDGGGAGDEPPGAFSGEECQGQGMRTMRCAWPGRSCSMRIMRWPAISTPIRPR